MTYKEEFNKKHGFKPNQSHTLEAISKLSGYQLDGLKIISKKGQGAYFSNPQSVREQVNSAQQWGLARVYAAINPKSKASKVDASHLKKIK